MSILVSHRWLQGAPRHMAACCGVEILATGFVAVARGAGEANKRELKLPGEQEGGLRSLSGECGGDRDSSLLSEAVRAAGAADGS